MFKKETKDVKAEWRGGVYLLVCAAVYGPPLGALAAAAGITWRPCRSCSGGARLVRCCSVGIARPA